MERFVRYLTVGGIALVAGLWLVELTVARTPPWVLGAALIALGAGGLLVGIGTEIERP